MCKAKLLRLMNSLLLLPLLCFLGQFANDLPWLQHRTARTRRDRSKIPVVESDDGIAATIDSCLQHHLIIRSGNIGRVRISKATLFPTKANSSTVIIDKLAQGWMAFFNPQPAPQFGRLCTTCVAVDNAPPASSFGEKDQT
jgi:hypothetical protein